MRIVHYVLAAMVLTAATPAAAQGWINYVSSEDMFTVNLPGEPTIEETTTVSQRGDTMPTRIYRANDGDSRYVVTVFDYAVAEVSDVRSSVSWEAWKVRSTLPEGSEITFDGYAQVDRIEGHQIQVTHADQSHTYYAWHLHQRKLYMLEATVPPGAPLPMLFQVSLSILDEAGEVVRYTIDADGQRVPDNN